VSHNPAQSSSDNISS